MKPATLTFYKRECQEKYFSLELKPGEYSSCIQPLPRLPVRCGVV